MSTKSCWYNHFIVYRKIVCALPEWSFFLSLVLVCLMYWHKQDTWFDLNSAKQASKCSHIWNFFTLSSFASIVSYVICLHLIKYLSYGPWNDRIFLLASSKRQHHYFQVPFIKWGGDCASPYPSWLCCAFVITTHVYISWGSRSRYITFRLQKQSESLMKIRLLSEDFQYAVFYGVHNWGMIHIVKSAANIKMQK
jgi:hypothetical protein